MLIPIKIQNKKYKIKPIDDLTTKEFINLCKIEKLNFVKYVAWQTGVKLEKAFYAHISRAVELAIGTVPDITKLPLSKDFDYDKKIYTVGQRHQIELCKYKDYDLLVFVLAVAQAQSNNINDVNKLRREYLKQPFKKVLPAGFFFFNHLQNGRIYGLNYFHRLRLWINTRILKTKQV